MYTRQTTTVKSGVIGIWLGLLVGALVGGAVALLYNPRSGAGNREMIKNRATQAKDAILWHARTEALMVESRHRKKK